MARHARRMSNINAHKHTFVRIDDNDDNNASSGDVGGLKSRTSYDEIKLLCAAIVFFVVAVVLNVIVVALTCNQRQLQ